uniref:Uncharacterized protein n=1 Tax=Anguilla anguilla TaxID=7936 RepID=A0A0E9SWP1_ANGAN
MSAVGRDQAISYFGLLWYCIHMLILSLFVLVYLYLCVRLTLLQYQC